MSETNGNIQWFNPAVTLPEKQGEYLVFVYNEDDDNYFYTVTPFWIEKMNSSTPFWWDVEYEHCDDCFVVGWALFDKCPFVVQGSPSP